MTKFLSISLACLFLILFEEVNAQYFNKLHYWKKSPSEISVGVGVGNYIGELGGSNGKKKPWLLDLELSQFKFSWQVGYRYNIGRYFATRLNFAWVKVAGSDALTSSPTRNYRNLSFKSNIYEGAIFMDLFFIRAKPGHIHHFKGVKGQKGQPFEVFGFVGVGGFYYRSTSGGVALAGLSTEGQGLEGGPKKYIPFSVSVPIGLGVNYVYYKDLKFGLDFTYRFTFTDYIDDASGVYYDNDKLREQKGAVSADLADRTDGSNPSWSAAGSPRGNPKNNDHFFSIMVNATYNLSALKKKSLRPGGPHSFNKRKRRMKF